jgi:hypothetical protein
MYNADIISMPDKWEYPWYATWDLAFHVIALTLVDEDFGKRQLELMLSDSYLHSNGQIPPMSGILAMSTLLCMPGLRFSHTVWGRLGMARAISTGLNAYSRSCSLTSPGG